MRRRALSGCRCGRVSCGLLIWCSTIRHRVKQRCMSQRQLWCSRRASNARVLEAPVFLIQFAAQVLSPVQDGDLGRRSAAHEGVEHDVTRPRTGQDARLDKGRRKSGEVCALVGAGGDGPDGAAVAGLTVTAKTAIRITLRRFPRSARRGISCFSTCLCAANRPPGAWLTHRLAIKEVPLRLRQQENVLMRLGAAVAYRRDHQAGA